MLKPNATVHEPEMACMEKIYSGGGFSNYFAMPEYQKDVVDNYLTNYYPNYPSTIWNSTGTVGFFLCLWPAASHANEAFQSRAFPDISANGANYVVAVYLLLWRYIQSLCCTGGRRIHSRVRNVLLFSSRWSDLHDDQRFPPCHRQRDHRFRQPDGKLRHHSQD